LPPVTTLAPTTSARSSGATHRHIDYFYGRIFCHHACQWRIQFFHRHQQCGRIAGGGATSWGTISDRNAKKTSSRWIALTCSKSSPPFRAALELQVEPDDAVPHLGPMAQDFKSAFYPGRDDKSITTLELMA